MEENALSQLMQSGLVKFLFGTLILGVISGTTGGMGVINILSSLLFVVFALISVLLVYLKISRLAHSETE